MRRNAGPAWSEYATINPAGTAQDLVRSFTHHPAGQIAARTTDNAAYEWGYALSNRAFTSDGLNRYTNVAGTAYTHDARGNLMSDGSRTFVYDVENRLTSVSGAASMTLDYDPLGRLRQTVSGGATTQFLYDGDRLTAEYNSTGTLLRRYAHGPGVDNPVVWYEGTGLTSRTWLNSDERGSIVGTSNGSGTATVLNYGPYGEQPTWTGVRFRYTGQIALPEVQLYHYKARVYDPGLGRFMQTDPIGGSDDLNLYGYAGNDPINYLDETGEGKKWVGWAVRLIGDQMKYAGKVTKEQAIRLRRQEQNFRARTQQQARQVESAAHGEQGMIRHKPHPDKDGSVRDGYRPHYQSKDKKGHSFWTAAAATTLGAAAGALDNVADAAQSTGAALGEGAEIASDIASALDPTTVLTSGSMAPPPGFREGPMGLWIRDEAQPSKPSDNNAGLMQCTGSRIQRKQC